VSRREHDSKWIWGAFAAAANRRKHHRDLRMRELSEHLSVTGKIVATGKQSRLIDRRGDDPSNFTVHRHRRSAFNRESREPARECNIAGLPFADHFVYLHATTRGADDHQIKAPANPWVCERLADDFRTDSAGVARCYGNALGHSYNLSATYVCLRSWSSRDRVAFSATSCSRIFDFTSASSNTPASFTFTI